ncbi:hypothetical protein P154DRAFT_47590 [Amniculicola lignicola CBS 123094]|uniref:Amidohydrolase-related domain-containing protein n=1 Tax=Amniculicola lignicola CBS 123094 TaxID=1392246 RepID=A0A6A5W458_9PLEO|nr:hypothetical protein P154DRAFT_47590 [Amniculicola lignicola CBS 123094]
MPPKLLDTHIHLWPSTSTTPLNHAWMTPGFPLAKRHGITDYLSTTTTSPIQPSSFIYIETDRYLPTPTPPISLSDLPEKTDHVLRELEKWAHEPLQELRFLRRMVEGTFQNGDGFNPQDGGKMAGCVIWAPFHLPSVFFRLYLERAERVAGPALWERVVGFRYLLQGIKQEEELRRLVESEAWLTNLASLRTGRAGKGWTFDIGVDAHSGGVWQLEVVADMVDRIRGIEGNGEQGRVTFVLDHLCKPDLSALNAPSQSRWVEAVARMARQPDVYMKFSGAFNEFGAEPTPSDIPLLLERLDIYFQQSLDFFGPTKVMFGSDWPVCNVGGPTGELSWGLWREVVETWLEQKGLGDEDKEYVWWKAGSNAYGIEP